MKSHPTIPGFVFAGINCGIKNHPQKDLGVILSLTQNTTVAGIFTQNRVKAAPVKLCQKVSLSGRGRLVVINSGVANAATGTQGYKDAQTVQRIFAKRFGVSRGETLVCSTGKIGPRIPLHKMKSALEKLKPQQGVKGFLDCARAIMTTDARPKTKLFKGNCGGKVFHMAVMAKGAGMICPNMATLLCFIMTDLKISSNVLRPLLKDCAGETLNCLSVDGDTSTNDTALLLANGLAGNKSFKQDSPFYQKVKHILTQLLDEICLQIALDGEGATRCARIFVRGAAAQKDAQRTAKAIANSPLVKTALHGADPNWGRILCAAGYSGARIHEGKTRIKIGPHTVFACGKGLTRNEKKAAAALKKKVVTISVDLGLGTGEAKMYACDLSPQYVRFNAHYRT